MPDAKPATDNMRIWNLASETDPTHTKNANLGAYKFTSIDSYYQLKRATEFFGPMGQGWGYDSTHEIIVACTPPLAMIEMVFWYIDPVDAHQEGMAAYPPSKRVRCPTIRATNRLTDNSGKPDEECFKKATTDALTKALSYLGFSADIFMGLYDDAKYRSTVDAKFKAQRAGQDGPKMPESLDLIVKSLPSVKDLPKLEQLFYSVFGNKAKEIKKHVDLDKVSPAQFEYLKLQFAKRKSEMAPEEPGEKDLGDQAGA